MRAEAVQQKRLERGKAAFEKLRSSAKRAKHRDAWEAVIRELDAAVRVAPNGPASGAAALLAAKARMALFEASRAPADAKAALAALRKVDDDHPGPAGREALAAAVQISLHTKDAGDRIAAARRLVERYPDSPEGKHWAARFGARMKKPVISTPPSKNLPVTVAPDEEDDDEDDGPAQNAQVAQAGASAPTAQTARMTPAAAAGQTAQAAAPTREPEVDVGRETARVIEQMIADAKAAKSGKGDAAQPAAPAEAARKANESESEDSDAEGPPEPEEPDTPASKTAPILRIVRDAMAKLSEPDEEPVTPTRAKELRSDALRSGSIAAQLGLKMRKVVVDAGHGGRDAGAIGPHGAREKDVALSIAKKVAARLKSLGFEVVMTRTKDVFVPLEERTRLANESKADLFVSIHCNAARKRTLAGVETWTLNVASNRYAARLASFENAEAERTVSELRMILADLATKANAGDARELAQSVQSSLVRTLRSRVGKVNDHGVKQALFYVLLGTHMPSILVETGFISNPTEEKRLRSPNFQEGTADAVARGLKDYVDGRRRLAQAP